MNAIDRSPPTFAATEDVLDALRDYARDHAPPIRLGDLDRRFLHMEKLLTLGQVTTEVAHDFGNLMTVVLGYSDLLLSTLGPETASRNYLEHLHRAAANAAALTTQLLGYMRDANSATRDVDLAALVHELEPMLARMLGRSVRLIIQTGVGAMSIRADPKRIEQAIVNLAVNSRDAIVNGGVITLKVAVARIAEPFPHRLGFAPAGDYVLLQIRDDGTGMEPETVGQLFQPFFTTKVGGTGLGLAIVARVLRELQAAVVVDSKPGCGSAFSLYFPQAGDR